MNPLTSGRHLGLILTPRRRVLDLAAEATTPIFDDVDWSPIMATMTPQRYGSCESESACNLYEGLIRQAHGRDAIPPGYQLPAEDYYWQARKRFYGDDRDQGLESTMTWQLLKEVGVLPLYAYWEEVQPTVSAIVSALLTGPLIQPLLIGRNWLPEYVHSVSGEIAYAETNLSNAIGGHQTVLHRYQRRGDHHWFGVYNSWPNWGYHGTGVISYNTWWQSWRWYATGPYRLVVPGLDQFLGWKDALVKR